MTLRLSLLLNSALVALKQATSTSLHLCVSQASKALDIHCDPVEAGSVLPMTKKLTNDERGKAYYRRGMAKIALKDLDEAYSDLQEAAKLVPTDKAIEVELKKVVAKKDDLKKKQQKAYSKMFA